jgi:hypothetical protein
VTPGGRARHLARLETRVRRRDEQGRAAARQAALEALSDDALQQVVLLGRRWRHEGPRSLSAAEAAELDSLLAPILALYEPDDELP